MAELSINFVNRIIPQLRSQASASNANLSLNVRRLLTEATDLQLAVLNEIYKELGNNSQILEYWFALYVHRTSVEAPLGQGLGLNAFQFVDYFVKLKPEFEKEIWSEYAQGLLLEVSASLGDALVQWGNMLIEYKDVEELKIPVAWLGVRLKSEISQYLMEFLNSSTVNNANRLVERIELAYVFSNEIEELLNFVVDRVLNYLVDSNDIDDFYKQINEPVNPDLHKAEAILKILQRIELNFNKKNKRLMKKIQDKINSLVHVKVPKKQFNNEDLIGSEIDMSSIQFEERALYEYAFINFSVRVMVGLNSSGHRIIVKQYYKFAPDFNFSHIDNEVKIMSFLSNRANTLKTFIKLYYVYRDNSQISLYMEDGGTNLMNFLTEKKRNNSLVDPKIIEGWIINLLESFAWLNNHSINHCDIKPHNILVKPSDLSLKIIDFSVSHFMKDSEASYNPTVAHPIQGTDGYMSPELVDALDKNQKSANYKPGKSDVFSLGLTFLQIITLEKLNGYNSLQLNANLLAKVDGINTVKWIKDLLRGMLIGDRRARLSFTKCLRFIPAEQATEYT